MKIGLYNEFPTENLENLRFIDFPVDVTVASPNLETFRRNEADIRKNFPQVETIAYWPILKKEEGYWISPFSDEASLNRIFGEIETRKDKESGLSVMLDLEPSFLVNKQQMLSGIQGFKRKKQGIEDFMRNAGKNNVKLSSAELPSCTNPILAPEFILDKMGLSYSPDKFKNYEKTRMIYTSFGKKSGILGKISFPFSRKVLESEAEKGVRKYRDKFSIGLGCICEGILGGEPILTPSELDEDLQLVEGKGVKKAYIYDLKGINQEYANVIKRHYA